MANTYIYEITDLKRDVTDGYVSEVFLDISIDNDKSNHTMKTVLLDKPDTLVPYADLTKDQVVAWAKTRLDSEVAVIEADLDAKLVENLKIVDAYGTPW